jgi:hypothetical protein
MSFHVPEGFGFSSLDGQSVGPSNGASSLLCTFRWQSSRTLTYRIANIQEKKKQQERRKRQIEARLITCVCAKEGRGC